MSGDLDPRTLPTWVTDWSGDAPGTTRNYGRTGGRLCPPLQVLDHQALELLMLELEISFMLAEAEYHANWGV